MAKEATRAPLRAFVGRRAELLARQSRLQAAQGRAEQAVRAAGARVARAQAELDEARSNGSQAAVQALLGGTERLAPMASASRQRAALLDAEDEKHVAQLVFDKISAELADVERALPYLTGQTETAEALAPYIAALLERKAAAQTAQLQCEAEIVFLNQARLVPSDLQIGVNLAIGLMYGDPPGMGQSRVRAPNTAALQAFLAALQTDPDAPAPVMA